MKSKFSLIIAILLVVFVLLLSTLYTVSEGQKALLLRLGKIAADDQNQALIMEPGLHFKLPFINSVRYFDVRLQTLDIDSSRIVTEEKKDVLVDYFAKWYVNNLPEYFTSTGGDAMVAENLLRQQLNDGLRAQFGKRTIKEVVADDRETIMAAVAEQARKKAATLGIEVKDVRIKRIDLPTEVSTAVFDRMRAERKRIATKHRADGKAEAEAIHAKADADAIVIVAKAREEAEKIRAEGDKEAAKIYNDAYSNSPDFYRFYRSLLTYTQTFNSKNDVLILGSGNHFFDEFNGGGKSTQLTSKKP